MRSTQWGIAGGHPAYHRPMPRYKLTVAYEGTEFHGWQKQSATDSDDPAPLRTAQGVLENAVREAVREPISLLGASRTDAGVHARGQVAAFTTAADLPPQRMMPAINARLPDDLLVVGAEPTHDAFNPISDAVAKGYRYCIAHQGVGGALRPLFDRRTTTYSAYFLDPERMRAAAGHFQGEHDFTSFTRKHHGRESTVRTVYDCSVTALDGDQPRLAVDVSGNGFLYNMVRIIVGTLVDVGRGRLEPEAIPDIIAARDRHTAGSTMPPQGLCLMWIKYS